MRNKKVRSVSILFALAVIVSLMAFRPASASPLTPIEELFPDPALAELVATNLGLEVHDLIVEEELAQVLVLNLNSGEVVHDFTGVERLMNLEHLYATNLGLTSLEPFGSLTNLRILGMNGNEITDLSPLSGMTSLTDVRLSSNPITQLSALGNLPNLEALDLSLVQAAPNEWDALRHLEHLRTLRLIHTPLENLDFLAELTMLEVLVLESNTNVSDLSPLSNLANLRHLEIIHNPVRDATPLAQLPQLETLKLINTELEDVDFVGAISNLSHLDLTGNRITDVSPLATLNVAFIDASYQWRTLPYIEVETPQTLHIVGIDGEDVPFEVSVGAGSHTDDGFVWHTAGVGTLVWESQTENLIFSGQLIQDAWEAWVPLEDEEWEEEEDLHDEEGEWVDCPYEMCENEVEDDGQTDQEAETDETYNVQGDDEDVEIEIPSDPEEGDDLDVDDDELGAPEGGGEEADNDGDADESDVPDPEDDGQNGDNGDVGNDGDDETIGDETGHPDGDVDGDETSGGDETHGDGEDETDDDTTQPEPADPEYGTESDSDAEYGDGDSEDDPSDTDEIAEGEATEEPRDAETPETIPAAGAQGGLNFVFIGGALMLVGAGAVQTKRRR